MLTRITGALEIAGGIAGTAFVLAGVLVLVVAVTEPSGRMFLIVALLLAAGSLLGLKKGKSRTRMMLGAVFLVALVISIFAALFIREMP